MVKVNGEKCLVNKKRHATVLSTKWVKNFTQSLSGPAPGTSTLTSVDLAVVMEVQSELQVKYNWQPEVLSTDIVGAEPCRDTAQFRTATRYLDYTYHIVDTFHCFPIRSNILP